MRPRETTLFFFLKKDFVVLGELIEFVPCLSAETVKACALIGLHMKAVENALRSDSDSSLDSGDTWEVGLEKKREKKRDREKRRKETKQGKKMTKKEKKEKEEGRKREKINSFKKRLNMKKKKRNKHRRKHKEQKGKQGQKRETKTKQN